MKKLFQERDIDKFIDLLHCVENCATIKIKSRDLSSLLFHKDMFSFFVFKRKKVFIFYLSEAKTFQFLFSYIYI